MDDISKANPPTTGTPATTSKRGSSSLEPFDLHHTDEGRKDHTNKEDLQIEEENEKEAEKNKDIYDDENDVDVDEMKEQEKREHFEKEEEKQLQPQDIEETKEKDGLDDVRIDSMLAKDENWGSKDANVSKLPPKESLTNTSPSSHTSIFLPPSPSTLTPRPVSISQLFRYSTPFEILLNALGTLAAIVAGSAQPLQTLVFGSVTTAFTEFFRLSLEGDDGDGEALREARRSVLDKINQNCLYLVYIGIGMLVASFVYMATWIYTSESITRKIRQNYLQAVLRQNIAYFDHLGAGEVATRIENDTHLIQDGIGEKIPITFMHLSTFFTAFIISFIKNWRIALLLSIMVPLIVTTGGIMSRFISEDRRKGLEATAQGGTLAEEAISSVRIVHAFGLSDVLSKMYEIPNMKAYFCGRKVALVNALGLGVFFFIIYGSFALAFNWGTTVLLNGHGASGSLVTCLFAIMLGSFSIAMIAPNLEAVAWARGAAGKIFVTIDRIPDIDSSSEEGLKPDSVEGAITFENVDFIYPSRPTVQVLKDFTITFPPGKVTALVGSSGSGKSTIVSLIERFYDPIRGNIMIDGNPINQLNIKWLRRQIGLVSQEPTLFATSVFGNVAHGLIGTEFEGAPLEEITPLIEAACKEANAHDFIMQLPEKYQTMIGERGMLLSGGQKQRVAIARAIVSNPRILLLDEATSALDTASEGVVQEALDKASQGRTTISIAHRLSTIRDADQIICMAAGQIVEVGRHEELMAKPEGTYKGLVYAQGFREKVHGVISEKEGDEEFLEDAHSSAPDGDEKSPGPLSMKLSQQETTRTMASQISPGKATKYSIIQLFKRIGSLHRGSLWLNGLGAACSIVPGAVYPVFGILLGMLIGVYSSNDSRPEIRHKANNYALYLFIEALIACVAVFLQIGSLSFSGERLARTLRQTTFATILSQDAAFFDREQNASGILTSAIAENAQKIQGLVGQTSGTIMQSCVTVVAGSIIGISYGWKLGLVGVACSPLNIATGLVRMKVVTRKDVKLKRSHEESAQLACEAASAIRTVASLTREKDVLKIYSDALEEPQKTTNRMAVTSNFYYSLTQGITYWIVALVFYYGSRLIVNEGLSINAFMVVMISVVLASVQAGHVFAFVPDASKAFQGARNVLTLLDSPRKIESSSEASDNVALPVPKCHGHVKFHDVHFRYSTRPHVPVLRGLSLEVKPGEFVAICGSSGGGKSTVVSLLERFYDPLKGKVTMDGRDISKLNVREYRQHLALVSQEPTLYAGSLAWNISLGAGNKRPEEVSMDEVIQAAKQANIHNFIDGLPDGYKTDVGGKGMQLSGGQKQRIAIARALIRNPKLLLLDEATSALDSESEKVVQQALDEASKGRGTIAVAHRLSTIQHADRIYVLREGQVAEVGRHKELMALKGIYYELVQQQALEH